MATKKKAPTTVKEAPFLITVLRRWLPTILLVCFFLFSVLAAGYVIFFQTVLAQGLEDRVAYAALEETYPVAIPELKKKTAVDDSGTPLIAIIIDDMGYADRLGRQLLSLELELSFSFLPFAPFTQELDEIAYKAGRTILLHLPLQPRDNNWNPGPGALSISENKDRLRELFERNLYSVPHATGVNNHMGSIYTENAELMKKLLAIIKDKALFFVDSFTTAKSVGMRQATMAGVKTARRHVFLDNIATEGDVCDQLGKLVEIAEREGGAIGIAHPNQATFMALSSCMDQFSSRVKLVSVTELLH